MKRKNNSPMDGALRLQAMAAEFGWSKERLTEELRNLRQGNLNEEIKKLCIEFDSISAEDLLSSDTLTRLKGYREILLYAIFRCLQAMNDEGLRFKSTGEAISSVMGLADSLCKIHDVVKEISKNG